MAYPWEKEFYTGEKGGLDAWDIFLGPGVNELISQVGLGKNPYDTVKKVAGKITGKEDADRAAAAAKQSARTMAEAEQNKLDFMRQVYEQSRSDQLPYMQTGRKYLDILNQEMGGAPMGAIGGMYNMQTQPQGMRYTGLGNDGVSQTNRPAGIVHENEMVLEAPMVSALGGAGNAREKIEALTDRKGWFNKQRDKQREMTGFQSGTGGYTAGQLTGQPRQSFWQKGASSMNSPAPTQPNTAQNAGSDGIGWSAMTATKPQQNTPAFGANVGAQAGSSGNDFGINVGPEIGYQNNWQKMAGAMQGKLPFDNRNVEQSENTPGQNLQMSAAPDRFRMDPASFDTSKYERPDFSFTAQDFQSNPYYEFLQKEGARNINRGKAAMGGLGTGGTLTALQQRGQDIAGREFGNQFNRALTGYNTNLGRSERDRAFDYNEFLGGYGREKGEKTDRYNRLANMAGLGQTTASGLGALGSQYGSQYGAGLSNIGSALGAGQVGAANAQAQGNQNLLNLLMQGASIYYGGM